MDRDILVEQYNNALTSPCVTVAAPCVTVAAPCVTVPAPCVTVPTSCVIVPAPCVTAPTSRATMPTSSETVSAPFVTVPSNKNFVLCIVCGGDIKTSKERRKLFQKDVKTSLCLRLEKYVKATISLCFQYVYTNCICRTCVRLLEQVEKLETKLRGKFEATVKMFETKYGRKKRVRRTFPEPTISSAPVNMDSLTPLVSKHSHMPPLTTPSLTTPVTFESLTPSTWQHSHRFTRPLTLPSRIPPMTMQSLSSSEIHSAVTACSLTSPVSMHEFSPSLTTYGSSPLAMYRLTLPVSLRHEFNLSVSKDRFTPSVIPHCLTPSVTTHPVTPSRTTRCVTSSVTVPRSMPQVITRSTPPEIGTNLLLPLTLPSQTSVREPILRQALKETVSALPVMHQSLPLPVCHTPSSVKVRNWLLPVTVSNVVSSVTKSSLSVMSTDARAPLPREPSFLKSIREDLTFLSPVTEPGCREPNFTTARDNYQHGGASDDKKQPDFLNGFTNGNI